MGVNSNLNSDGTNYGSSNSYWNLGSTDILSFFSFSHRLFHHQILADAFYHIVAVL